MTLQMKKTENHASLLASQLIIGQIDQAIRYVLSEIVDERLKSKILSFWDASIAEFHLYYLGPVISLTICGGGESRVIRELDSKSITGNGISVAGVRDEKVLGSGALNQLSLQLLRVGSVIGRLIYGRTQSLKSYFHSFPEKDLIYSVWAPTGFYFEAFNRILIQQPTLFLTHQKSTYDLISERVSKEHVYLIQNEVVQDLDFFQILKHLSRFKKRIISMRFQCDEHGTVLNSMLIWNVWLNFLVSRWPAYFSFQHSANQIGERMKERGIQLFIAGQDRNMRERVWCQTLRKKGIASVIVEPCLYDDDPAFRYPFVTDRVFVDSKYTETMLKTIATDPSKITAVGHAGVSLLCERRLSAQQRGQKKGIWKIEKGTPVVFYGTHDFSDVTAGTTKSLSAEAVKTKSMEFGFLVSMAKKHGFHILVKPHLHENEDFYRSRLKPSDPVTVIENTYSSHELLTFVDALVTRWSTVGYEAMSCGVPVFYLNFYYRQPNLSCFHEPKIIAAGSPESAEELFDDFWKVALSSEYAQWVQSWAASQGWDPGSDLRILNQLQELTVERRS